MYALYNKEKKRFAKVEISIDTFDMLEYCILRILKVNARVSMMVHPMKLLSVHMAIWTGMRL
ncbi:hypothetical protein [Salmonella phage SD-2_S15]|nr:hypothetical protein [Salmonella phage SD-2_S15]